MLKFQTADLSGFRKFLGESAANQDFADLKVINGQQPAEPFKTFHLEVCSFLTVCLKLLIKSNLRKDGNQRKHL